MSTVFFGVSCWFFLASLVLAAPLLSITGTAWLVMAMVASGDGEDK